MANAQRKLRVVPKKEEEAEPIRRTVRTVYYLGKEVVKLNRSGKPLNAVKNTVGYMRDNRYKANLAEVYDLNDGKLYAVVTRNIEGHTRIHYERKHKEGDS